MNLEWLDRLALAALFFAVGVGACWFVNRFILARTRSKGNQLPVALSGSPAILYFTTPDCAPCKTVQRPALNELQELLGAGLQVIEVNAVEQSHLASAWGVLSVPTTFVLDKNGKARHVNHGVARAEKLLDQIKSL
ncbi:MAG: hypothetical protein Fur002_25100 [Anaerolineales bacterium]